MSWIGNIPKEQLLGTGLYTPQEAAMYVDVRTQQIVRWIHGNSQGSAVVSAQFPRNRDLLTFLDMVQAMAIRDMRRLGISLPRIRDAAAWVMHHYPEMHFPFAHRHQTYVCTATSQIIIVRPGDDPNKLIQVSGENKGQLIHKSLLDEYLKQLEFDSNGLAVRFSPFCVEGRRIVLDPEIRSGQPRVLPCGYLVRTLAEAYEQCKSLPEAANLYGIDEADVRVALKYLEWTRKKAG